MMRKVVVKRGREIRGCSDDKRVKRWIVSEVRYCEGLMIRNDFLAI